MSGLREAADPDDLDEKAAAAQANARRAHWMSILWWSLIPMFSTYYWLSSVEPISEKVLGLVIADVSFIANAVTYASKAAGFKAEAAGYSNP